MSRNFVCAECGGKLQLGIIVDHGEQSIPFDAAYWMEGKREEKILYFSAALRSVRIIKILYWP